MTAAESPSVTSDADTSPTGTNTKAAVTDEVNENNVEAIQLI